GLTVLLLGLAGLAVAPRRYRAVAVVASTLAILVSLGPQTALYRFLHENLVFVRGVRALSRFSLLPVLSLDVLAGIALSGRRHGLAVAALVLMLAESSNVPIRYARYPGPPDSARWLAGRRGRRPTPSRPAGAPSPGRAGWASTSERRGRSTPSSSRSTRPTGSRGHDWACRSTASTGPMSRPWPASPTPRCRS